MVNIVLVGEYHTDPCLAEHAEDVLRVENPDAITLESCPAERVAFAFVRTRLWELLSQQGIPTEGIGNYVRDYCRIARRAFSIHDVCREYACTHHIPLEYIGHPDQKSIQQLLEIYERPIPIDSVLHPVVSTNAEGPVAAAAYKNCRTRIAAGSYSGVSEWDRHMLRTPTGEKRDVYSAERLRVLVKQGRRKICHFCGMGHMLDDFWKETIYSILKGEFDVERITIDQHSRG